MGDSKDKAAPGLSRRQVLLSAPALAAACAVSGAAAEGPAAPERGSFRIPADFEPARAIWVGWDEGHRSFTAALVQALRPHAQVEVVVRDETAREAAREWLQGQGVTVEALGWHTLAEAMYFVRDGVVFATNGKGDLGVVDFQWNHYGRPGWCHSAHAPRAREVAACTGESWQARQDLDRALAARLGGYVFEAPMVAEGGGVESNGQGLMIANEALVRQRHPDLPLAELQRRVRALPGVRKVIWLPAGLAHDPVQRGTIVGSYVGWGTGGHTDEFVRFADPRTVLLAWPEDIDVARHPVARLNRARMQRNVEILSRATDAYGRPLRVLKVPLPRHVERRVVLSRDADPTWSEQWSPDWFPARERRRQGDTVTQVAVTSYLNFVVANQLVLVPGYLEHGTPQAVQDRVRRTFEQAFPGRTVRFIDAMSLNWYGGGPHCATLNEPLRPRGGAAASPPGAPSAASRSGGRG